LRPCQPSQQDDHDGQKSLQKSLQLGRAGGMAGQPGKRRSSTACPIRRPDTNYLVRFTAPEFTSICPVTGQPDFAHLMIDYVPASGCWNPNR
jgi:7-cyano-7-deazaguanine reductase